MSATDIEKQSQGHDPNMAEASSREHVSNEEEEKGALDHESRSLIALIMLALCLAVFLAALDVTIITTALPTIAEYFHSSAGYTWIGASYVLASSASTPFWGKVSDVFGRKPILLLANFIFFIGSLISALSISIGMLLAGRSLQGLASGGLLVLVDIVICDMFSMRKRGTYLGVIGGTWAIASVTGPLIGGAFTQKVSWRWCFWVNLPLDGLAFIIILLFLKIETPRTPIVAGLLAIDWLGTFTIVGGTLLFLFGLQYGGVTFPWNSPTVICLLIFGVLLSVLFGIVEWKFAKYPVMPLRIFKYRSNIGVLVAVFFHGLAFIGPFYYLPLFMQVVRGASPLLSGVYILPLAGGVGIAAIGAGATLGATGQYLPVIFAGWILMVLGCGLLIDLDASSGWAKLVIYQIIAGLGTGALFQPPLVALQTHIAQADMATATAAFSFSRTLADALGVVLGQVVYQNQLIQAQPYLISQLGPDTAAQLSGSNAGANTDFINSLPSAQRQIARDVFSNALSKAWIMYTCFAAAGMLCSLLIKQKVLSSDHKVVKLGLEAERENAEMRRVEKEEKAARKSGGRV